MRGMDHRSACAAGFSLALMVGGEGSREARFQGPRERERRDSASGPSHNSGLRQGSQTELLRQENRQTGPGGGLSPAHAA